MCGLLIIPIYIVGFFLTWLILRVAHELDHYNWYEIDTFYGKDSSKSWMMIIFWPFTYLVSVIFLFFKGTSWIMNKTTVETAKLLERLFMKT